MAGLVPELLGPLVRQLGRTQLGGRPGLVRTRLVLARLVRTRWVLARLARPRLVLARLARPMLVRAGLARPTLAAMLVLAGLARPILARLSRSTRQLGGAGELELLV